MFDFVNYRSILHLFVSGWSFFRRNPIPAGGQIFEALRRTFQRKRWKLKFQGSVDFVNYRLILHLFVSGWSFFHRKLIPAGGQNFEALRWTFQRKRQKGTRIFLNLSAQSTVLFIPIHLRLLPVIINLLTISALFCSSIDGEFIFAGKDHSKLGHKKQRIRKRGGFVFRIYEHGKDR